MDPIIDLRSDTVTRPSPEMRRAMAEAEVGDDVYGEDPSVNELQEYAAALFGKEAALFVPSGTMANLIAFLSQTRPGDTIILSEESHPYHYEGANLAVFGGLLTAAVPDLLGKLTPLAVQERLCQIDDPHFSHTTLVSIENTTNRGGGACYTGEEVAAIAEASHAAGLKLHCDGARIFNACIATGTTPGEYARHCDTLSVCLSKGLGAPVGSLLLGPRTLMRQALRWRKMLGGGMRQAGILAAAGLFALKHNVDELGDDHRRTREFRQALTDLGASFPLPSPTNILYVSVPDAYWVTSALAERGVYVLPHGDTQIRVVFHRDIDDDALEQAIAAFDSVFSNQVPQ